jgi:hypothetical protein
LGQCSGVPGAGRTIWTDPAWLSSSTGRSAAGPHGAAAAAGGPAVDPEILGYNTHQYPGACFQPADTANNGSSRSFGGANMMQLMRSESSSTDTLVAMLASCGSPMAGGRLQGLYTESSGIRIMWTPRNNHELLADQIIPYFT